MSVHKPYLSCFDFLKVSSFQKIKSWLITLYYICRATRCAANNLQFTDLQCTIYWVIYNLEGIWLVSCFYMNSQCPDFGEPIQWIFNCFNSLYIVRIFTFNSSAIDCADRVLFSMILCRISD